MSTIIIFILLTLILQAFFSGTETAMVSSNKMRIRSLYEKGDRRAKIIWKMLKDPQQFLTTTLVGTNICVVTSSALTTFICIKAFGQSGSFIAPLIMIPLSLVFGEMTPKTICRMRANQIILFVAPMIYFFRKLLFPITKIINFTSLMIAKALGVKKNVKPSFLDKEELELLVQQITTEGVLEEDEQETIYRIFQFRRKKTIDVMVKKENVVSVDYRNNKEALLEKTQKHGFTRFPVFKNKKIVGIINIFDLFYQSDLPWQEHIRPIRCVSQHQNIDKLFAKMKPKKETMAAIIVRNQMIGIVTIEDIMEEIVLPED